MKQATFEIGTDVGPVSRIGALDGDTLVDLTAGYERVVADRDTEAVREAAEATVPPDMIELLRRGSEGMDAVGDLMEMRDRFDLQLQLLSDPEREVTKSYTEVVADAGGGDCTRSGTFVVDADRTVRYEQVETSAADRTYANYVRQFVKQGYEDVYGSTPGGSL